MLPHSGPPVAAWQPVRASRRFALVSDAPPRGAAPQAAPAARVSTGATWAVAQRAHLARTLGTHADAAEAARLITSHLLPGTYESYGRHWQRFVDYCTSRNLAHLPALPATVVCYIAHLSTLGTLQPQSSKNPISAINKAHTDLGYPEPATGGLVAAVRRGWALEARAAPSGQSDQRVGLPASVASRCLDLANRRTVSSVLLRAFVYVGFGFALMARSDTDINLQRQDVELTPSRIFGAAAAREGAGDERNPPPPRDSAGSCAGPLRRLAALATSAARRLRRRAPHLPSGQLLLAAAL